ncbi:hypothetical protein [Xylocopilactobacillus apicola]|uniref:Uncharacterized protein n=1 Tax=Xylocopilactobacillus apicola TaxID=2932184 RepID=A0AAU9DPH1_9LACO|nr:hypothetical protein [Xylocopilactobacillus apicola]BDR57694.1 hypothetical protein XA3_01350 [Xylocopilactobacillus apicola]
MNKLVQKILNNRNDLIEGTFCYELFENKTFNATLFEELIKDIKNSLNEDEITDFLDFVPWVVMNTMHCIICHNDTNDSYFILNMDMDLWYETYENLLSDVLNSALLCQRNR